MNWLFNESCHASPLICMCSQNGSGVGDADGAVLTKMDGPLVGATETVGERVGWRVLVGEADGDRVVGNPVGVEVGAATVGSTDGEADGPCVGTSVG